MNASDMDSLKAYLRRHGVKPTAPRLRIAGILFARPAHLSAEDIYKQVAASDRSVAKATVYNTLGLFVEKGLVREVLVDSSRVFYDSNTCPHHHLYDVSTGCLTDIPANDIEIKAVPELPAGLSLEAVDVVVRVRSDKPG